MNTGAMVGVEVAVGDGRLVAVCGTGGKVRTNVASAGRVSGEAVGSLSAIPKRLSKRPQAKKRGNPVITMDQTRQFF